MDTNQEYFNIINYLALHEKYIITDKSSEKDRKFIHYLMVNDYLYKDIDEFKISKKGYDFLKSKLTFDEFDKRFENRNTGSGNVIIHGNIHDSSLSNNPNINAQINTVQNTNNITPRHEKTGWLKSMFKKDNIIKTVLSIIASLVTAYLIYYFGIS